MSNFIFTINEKSVNLTVNGVDNVSNGWPFGQIQRNKRMLLLFSAIASGRMYGTPIKRWDNGTCCCNLLANDGQRYNCIWISQNGTIMISPFDGLESPLVAFPEFNGLIPDKILELEGSSTTEESPSNCIEQEYLGYSPYELNNEHLVPITFPELPTSSAQQNSLNSSINPICQAENINFECNAYFHRGFDYGFLGINPWFPDMQSSGMVHCFYFHDKNGKVVLKVLKAYSNYGYGLIKFYFPMIYLYDRYINTSFPVFVGLPDKQILYNLHKIAKAESVIICSSLDLALANQQINPTEEIVFTAFVCDNHRFDHRFDQVDFTPLKGKSVKLLITNHSGITLAESYQETAILYEYLRDEVGIEGIGFIQMEVVYPIISYASNVTMLLTKHEQQKPQIINDSVIELTEAEFPEMLSKATAEINRKFNQSQDKPFWKTSPVVHEAAAAATLSEQYISKREAAKILSCSPDTIERLIASDKIKCIKLSPARSGRVRIEQKSLLDFVKNNSKSYISKEVK